MFEASLFAGRAHAAYIYVHVHHLVGADWLALFSPPIEISVFDIASFRCVDRQFISLALGQNATLWLLLRRCLLCFGNRLQAL